MDLVYSVSLYLVVTEPSTLLVTLQRVKPSFPCMVSALSYTIYLFNGFAYVTIHSYINLGISLPVI
jgi:hypothetical protein